MKYVVEGTLMKKRSLKGHKFGFCLVLGLTCICLGFFMATKFLKAVTIVPAIIDLPLEDGRWISFYDWRQKEVIKVFVREQTKIRVSQMPTLLQRAFVQNKDARFFNHNRSISDLSNTFILEVKAFFGLSALNQYYRDIPSTLAYNLFLIRKKSLPHRLDEAILAYKIERKYRKEEILECYLNNIYFGEGILGVEAASSYYFGKTAIKLQPHETAFLIGLATDTLSPDIAKKEQLLHNPAAAKTIRDQVLDQMARGGIITLKQAGDLKRKPLGVVSY